MIISHQYKFIFIKTEKTAGTSFEVFFSRNFAFDKDVVTTIYPGVDGHQAQNFRGLFNPISELKLSRFIKYRKTFPRALLTLTKFYNHMPARLVKERVSPNIWNNYYKFCVERNPWDKVISHFSMINAWAGGKLTMDEYLSGSRPCVNYPKYCDDHGNIMVDHILRYEDLDNEMTRTLDFLGIDCNQGLNVRAKSSYRKSNGFQKSDFTDSQLNRIGKIFKNEIDLMNYKFE